MTMQVEVNYNTGLSTVEVVPRDGIDVLSRFELLRRHMYAPDHSLFRSGEVIAPSTGIDDSLRMVAYLENAEKSLNTIGSQIFRPDAYWQWTTRGFINWHPHYDNAISTGTYWAGVVVLGIDTDGNFYCAIEWTVQWLTSYDYFLEIKRFLEGEDNL